MKTFDINDDDVMKLFATGAFDDIIVRAEARSRKQTSEIFGKRSHLAADEEAIAFNRNLTHEEKVKQLTALSQAKAEKRAARRAAKLAAALEAARQFTKADVIRARGMGISI